jgi:hypothetical protein
MSAGGLMVGPNVAKDSQAVKIEYELWKRIHQIAVYHGMKGNAWVAQVLRPIVRDEFAKMLAAQSQELANEDPPPRPRSKRD